MNLTTFRRARGACAALILFSAALVNTPLPLRAAHADFKARKIEAKKILVAHRGASAYAPEHTIESYELAIKQSADFVEQDLQVTKDGVLVCLHDETLERTTNVEDVFPDRFVKEGSGETVKRWYVADFTLEEIKRLDAGSWFGPQFKGARVPTFGEAIKLIRGRAGLYPETKAPEVYGRRGFEMERLLLAELTRHGLDRPGADARTPVIIQSFSAASLRKMRAELKTALPLVLLIGGETQGDWLTPAGMKRAREFAQGLGPAKALVSAEVVKAARAAGLTVTPYTFRSRATGHFASVREEMNHFLYTLDADAVFTDNPDEFPRERSRR